MRLAAEDHQESRVQSRRGKKKTKRKERLKFRDGPPVSKPRQDRKNPKAHALPQDEYYDRPSISRRSFLVGRPEPVGLGM